MNISAYRAEKLAKAAQTSTTLLQVPTASCSEIPSAVRSVEDGFRRRIKYFGRSSGSKKPHLYAPYPQPLEKGESILEERESAPAAKNQGDAAQAAYTQAAKKALEEMLMEAQSTEKTTLAMRAWSVGMIGKYLLTTQSQRFESSVTNVKECHLKSYRTSGQVDRSLIGLDG
ncbi:hypothetical protein H4Q26_012073 [Puccinia striiformis f. sp. tritici PST-130]|nr:hypothetical protein H4Q26_012073 [Puccinia striiformis f. sp. tritici PST-130]